MRYSEIEKITGVPARRIRYYATEGLLTLGEQNPGRGVGRDFSWKNLLELLIIKEFAEIGLEFSKIKRALDVARQYGREMFEPGLYTKGANIYLKISSELNDTGFFILTKGINDIPYENVFAKDAGVALVHINKLVEKLNKALN